MHGIVADYALSLVSGQTRNFAAGKYFAEHGELPKDYLAEGVHSIMPLIELARSKNLKMAIVEAVAKVLDGKMQLKEAVELLMTDGQSATF